MLHPLLYLSIPRQMENPSKICIPLEYGLSRCSFTKAEIDAASMARTPRKFKPMVGCEFSFPLD